MTQVREVHSPVAAGAEYARGSRLPPRTPPRGQWQLAEWCRQQSLFDERQGAPAAGHRARSRTTSRPAGALGFQFLDGQWITRADFRRQEGYELYKGKWRTPQEIEILEEQARLDQAQKDWLKKLRRYRAELTTPRGPSWRMESLTGIKDPIAVRPIVADAASASGTAA